MILFEGSQNICLEMITMWLFDPFKGSGSISTTYGFKNISHKRIRDRAVTVISTIMLKLPAVLPKLRLHTFYQLVVKG